MSRVTDNSGYTLTELIIVIAIIGILTSVCIVKIQCDQDVLLEKCANRLMYDIRYIQMKTIYEKNTNYRIYADYGTNRFQYQIQQPGRPDEIVKLDEGISFVSTITGNYVEFNTTGVPNPPGSFILKNNKSKQIKITIEFSTGRVRKKKP
ncbi:prepilin-type N-terminal cleavage/methylation domain-containing protein [Petroclostridium sp. X23]|uniref:prepilin-type N-terminal cleavage/methylation domain-containing protein n=1 Tax=Petroclostridium sp. X23 TaxID=3045146 RepID=UPI0024AC9EF9|nr:prepilin-type N-terminal cleavage/methylation domain-containing protein [Petroclostridium sp. X23]WHH59663.1 prepilin-type N-terminal cleavage/methylation domain-containing protein [Petroclostridium sp. X23]